jgi:3-methyl-2-oxobutanoate hydroxymethyltransferase
MERDLHKKTIEYLQASKARSRKISALTCYDYPTAVLEERAGIDILLVGDSLGTNVLGYRSERDVTMDDMVHHLRAVRRGVSKGYLLVDLPFRSYETKTQALTNAQRFVSEGADGVKLEGSPVEVIRYLRSYDIQVWGHLGLNPQLHDKMALHAKTADAAVTLLDDAKNLEEAGICALVLEMIPEIVGKVVTERVRVPTIGIGAGRYTDGQVLIAQDLLGINTFELRHVTRYDDLANRVVTAFRRYADDVEAGGYPAAENVRHLTTDEHSKFMDLLEERATANHARRTRTR